MELAVTRNSRRWALPLLLIGVVAGVSSTAHARVGWVEALAASPERIREGKVWMLFSSAALVDHPLVLSLVCFVALAGLTLGICGPRLFWSSALLGQIVATLLVYIFIGAARWIVPGAFDSSVTAPDFGVSAISAAWLGSLAAVGWRRHDRDWRGRLSIVLCCVAVGLFAYSVRPDLSVLSSEHFVAFGLGIGAAVPGFGARTLSAMRRGTRAPGRALTTAIRAGKLDPLSTVAVLLAVLLMAIAGAPTALAELRAQVAIHLHPTASRCATSWNRERSAPRTLVARLRPDTVAVAAARGGLLPVTGGAHPRFAWADFCAYSFGGRDKTVIITGEWRRGRVSSWHGPFETRDPRERPRANASLQPGGHLHLSRDAPGSKLVLS
jgi:hypothetical protein